MMLMRTQIKFHALAILAIAAIVIVAYLAAGNTKTVANSNQSASSIAIAGATWGLNCNTAITQAIEARSAAPLEAGGATNEPLTPVTANNVLSALGRLCNDKPDCAVKASSAVLGHDPMHSCFKRLLVSYRCFNVDALHTRDIGQGEMLTINCSESEAPDAASKPNAY
jgi:hypothetical protein